MTNNDVILSVEDVDKTFTIASERVDNLKSIFLNPIKAITGGSKKFHVLNDISFQVKKGEFLGILGKNGSGKSTLLKIIAGIYSHDKGNININGKLVPFLELGVGFNPDLSARENIFLNGTILGMSKAYITENFDKIVDFAEIREFLDVPLKNFSSGMMVRLAFSIAIMADADVYLLDEILAVGDANFQQKCLDIFLKLKKEGKTVILVSHSETTIKDYCDRAVLLHNGRIVASGLTQEVLSNYNSILLKNPSGLGNRVDSSKDSITLEHDFSKNYLDDPAEVEHITPNRWGNFQVSIDEVEYKNEGMFDFNSPVDGKVKLKINKEEVRSKLSKLGITMGLYNQKDALIYLDTRIVKDSDFENGIITIPFSLQIPNLIDGFYRFTIRIEQKVGNVVYVYDHWDKDNRFYVQNEESYYPGIINAKSMFHQKAPIVGMLRVRNEELILKDTLDSFSKIVDKIILLDDASEDKTVEIARSHPAVVEVIENKIWNSSARVDQETKHRKELLKRAHKYSPEWIFYSDADERFLGDEYGDIREFLLSKESKDIDAIRIQLFDAYMTEDDQAPYQGGTLLNFRKYFGPEQRNIIMLWRDNGKATFDLPDQREPSFPENANIVNMFYCQHYGKSISEEQWEETCNYYTTYFPEPYKSKWEERKGKAVHTQSDFGKPLYDWENAKLNANKPNKTNAK